MPKPKRRTEPKPVPLDQERCYCQSMKLPHVHTLGDHR